MKTQLRLPLLFLALLSLSGFARGQGTEITYQGRLNHAGTPATGLYDFTFAVFDVEAGGAPLAGPDVLNAEPVTNGLFNVSLDFGRDIFTGAKRWLEIAVRSNGSMGAHSTLSPRQALTPAPYAIFATTSGTASNVVNGSVVKSLNNLRDNVTLAAGANVTITPSGNTLMISSAGAGGSGIWSVNGNNASYTAGNVGIGTLAPASKLEVQGTVGAIRLNPDLITIGSNNDGYELSLVGGVPDGSSAGGQIRLGGSGRSDGDVNVIQFKQNDSEVMRINNAGNVGIGTSTFTPGVRLEVNGATRVTTGGSGGAVHISAPNGESGLGILGANRADLRFDGATLKLVAGVGTGPPPSANGIAINTAGNVGIGTTTPVAKLQAETSQADTAAIYGYATGPGGIGVYGQGPSGTAIYADGNARQRFDRGGFVKAMIHVRWTGEIVRCFNGINNTSGGGCGFVITTPLGIDAGVYRINFGFPVSDRFVSVTAQYQGINPSFDERNRGANYRFFDSTSVEVFMFVSGNSEDTRSGDFMIILY